MNGVFDFNRLRRNVAIAIKQLDRLIDRNFYPIEMTERSNSVGVRLDWDAWDYKMSFKLKLPFDSPEAHVPSPEE